ncbi:MAG: 50S ribosomal protein L23 [Tissierellia bacterium]|jgi:large subunit ribosomal protein L23|nr:50S ribosomal protein L23 [Tissierellia bacterium]
MERYYDIIKRPIITEESVDQMEENKYTFEVSKGANKTEIKKAIEHIFDVKVEKVYTQNRRGKIKRQGATSGRRPNWKKAIVKLAPGSKSIEFFEGM